MKEITPNQKKDTVEGKYSVGQVWRYQNRPGEDSSLLYIGAIDTSSKYGDVYSIYVTNLNVRHPHIAGGVQRELPHLPVTRATLDASVTDRADTPLEPEGFEGGYNQWKREFDARRAGAFTMPLAEVVSIVEESVNQSSRK